MKQIFTFFIFAFLAINLSAQTKDEPSGKISGVFFMDYYYNAVRDTGFYDLPNKAVNGEKDVHGLQLRRIFFTYDYKFNTKFSSKFRLESDEANFTTNATGTKASKFAMVIKDAYIKYNYFGYQDIYVGIQSTVGFDVSENVWSNRYIEKTIMDLRGIVPSRDFGIMLKGSLDSVGILKYSFMYANNGAGLPEADKYKRYYFQLELTPIKNLSVSLFADYQEKKQFEDLFNTGKTLDNNYLTAAFFVGYKKKEKFSVGIEVYAQKIDNGYKLTDSYKDKIGTGTSAFANLYFTKKTNLFVRYDLFEPNNHKDNIGDTRKLIIAGLAYKPNEKITISPNIFVESFEKVGDRKIKNSITPRITINWGF